MTELNRIEERLERLERQNWRWRAASFALLAVLVAGAAFGENQKVETFDVVKARRFEVYDGDKLRGRWDPGYIGLFDNQERLNASVAENGFVTWPPGSSQHSYLHMENLVAVFKDDLLKERLVIRPNRIGLIDDANRTRVRLDQSGVTVFPLESAPKSEKEFMIDPKKVGKTKPPNSKP